MSHQKVKVYFVKDENWFRTTARRKRKSLSPNAQLFLSNEFSVNSISRELTSWNYRKLFSFFNNIFLAFFLTRLGFLFSFFFSYEKFLRENILWFFLGTRVVVRTSPNEICDDTGPVLISARIHICRDFENRENPFPRSGKLHNFSLISKRFRSRFRRENHFQSYHDISYFVSCLAGNISSFSSIQWK